MFNPFLPVSAAPPMQRSQALVPEAGPGQQGNGVSGPNSFAQALAQRQLSTPRTASELSPAAPAKGPVKPQAQNTPVGARTVATAEARTPTRPAQGPAPKSAKPTDPADAATGSPVVPSEPAAADRADPPTDADPGAMSAWLTRWSPSQLPADGAPAAVLPPSDPGATTASPAAPGGGATLAATPAGGGVDLPVNAAAGSGLTASPASTFTNPFGAPETQGTGDPAPPGPGAEVPSGMVRTMFGLRPAPAPGAPITNPFVDALPADPGPGTAPSGDSTPVNPPLLTDPGLAQADGSRPGDPATTAAQTGVIDPAVAAALLAGQAALNPVAVPAPAAVPVDSSAVGAAEDDQSSERRFMTTVPRGSLPMRSPFGEPGTDAAPRERGLPPGGLPDPGLTAPLTDTSLVGNPFAGEHVAVGRQEVSGSERSFGQLLELAAQSGAHAAGAPAGLASTSPAVDVSLPTPAHSPEFPEALGVQVSLLAKDGVEHAELHLNPAEMGPISVRIALEGKQAQIDFGADSAATRALIEAGLPELASALREAGLTLSGGGVSAHSRDGQTGDSANSRPGDPNNGQPGSGAPGRGPRGGLAPGDTAAAPPQVRRVRVSDGVDLYA